MYDTERDRGGNSFIDAWLYLPFQIAGADQVRVGHPSKDCHELRRIMGSGMSVPQVGPEMMQDEFEPSVSRVPTALIGGGGTHTQMVLSIKINQETVCCDPSEPKTEFNDTKFNEPESDKLLITVSSSLTFETMMLPRILSSIRVATYLPENPQEDTHKVTGRHSQDTSNRVQDRALINSVSGGAFKKVASRH